MILGPNGAKLDELGKPDHIQSIGWEKWHWNNHIACNGTVVRSNMPSIFPCMGTQDQTISRSSYEMYQCNHNLYAK